MTFDQSDKVTWPDKKNDLPTYFLTTYLPAYLSTYLPTYQP